MNDKAKNLDEIEKEMADAGITDDVLEDVTDQQSKKSVKEQGIAVSTAADARNLDLILDIPLKVTVELGRTKMVVSELLNLGQGSVVELSKLAGEPMEVLVNDKLVARGEAVVVNEKFGVRLTDIISPTERVEQLR